VASTDVVGPLVKPLGVEFGWSRAAVSSAIMIAAIGTLLIGPWAGHLADRVGPRRVALVGLLLLAAATALIGGTGPSVWSWYAGWTVFGIVQTGCGNVIWMNGVVSRFDRNRGLALGLMLSGVALTNGFAPRFVVAVLSAFNWRAVFLIIASFIALVGWPLVWAFFYGASDLGRRRGVVKSVEAKAARPHSQKALLYQAFRRPQFWMMAIAFVMVACATDALLVHLVPILSDAGMSAQEAANVAFIIGPATIFGGFTSGYALDRLPPRLVTAAALSLPTISYALLLSGQTSFLGASVCAFFVGTALGTETQTMAYLVSRYFPQEAFGAIYGILLGLFAMSFGIGPVVAGWVFDVTRSYELSFVYFAAAPLLSAFLIASLGRPRRNPLSPQPA
jgi:predicted MFS family arabinose efflux permease